MLWVVFARWVLVCGCSMLRMCCRHREKMGQGLGHGSCLTLLSSFSSHRFSHKLHPACLLSQLKDPTKFSGKKSKAAAKKGPGATQWGILQLSGIPESEIPAFATTDHWLQVSCCSMLQLC